MCFYDAKKVVDYFSVAFASLFIIIPATKTNHGF